MPIEAFSKSLAGIWDSIGEFAENTLDLIIDNPIIKNIPIIKTILAGKDIGVSIYQRHQVIKLLRFFAQLNSYKDNPSIEKMRKKLLEDKNYLRKEAELTLIILDKITEVEKSELIAKSFFLYISGTFSEKNFKESILIIEQIYYIDLSTLAKVSDDNQDGVELEDISALNRLEACGLIRINVIDENEFLYNHYIKTESGNRLIKIINLP
jgi:hypothetical protein